MDYTERAQYEVQQVRNESHEGRNMIWFMELSVVAAVPKVKWKEQVQSKPE